MDDEEKTERLLARLRFLAKRNAADFKADPLLLASFNAALAGGLFDYVLDPETCGEPDCWHTWKEILARDKDRGGRFRIDCEDGSCALAGALYLEKPGRSMIGVKLGKKISHAVAGELGKKGRVLLLDPAVWAGMNPLPPESYEQVKWRLVR